MAHIAKLGSLTDELVELITSVPAKTDSFKFNVYKESALRGLKNTNYPRTNQFDVTSRLEGLDEKFRVYNEEKLADALEERLNTLSKLETKWMPEILHLLLELSDKPVTNCKLDDLDFLKESEPDLGPPLRWKDLVAEDPLLRDKGIWRNVDFGAESSDEDGFEDSRSELSGLTETTIQSSIDDDLGRRPQDYIVQITDKEELQNFREAQFWLKTPSVGGVRLETVKKPITELQAIREVLFMFSGFLTSLFDIQVQGPATITPSKSYALKHISTDAFYKLVTDFADRGSEVALLRAWVKHRHSIPLLQILQNSILECLSKFDALLSKTQQRFVAPSEDVVVSLLSVQTELLAYLQQLSLLSNMTKRLDSEPYAHAFRYLEMLYDETCTSQMAGDDDVYEFMGKIFFKCFQVYLRPIRTWMEEGELNKRDKVFFVSESNSDVESAHLWQSRFMIRKTQEGVLHAPRFLQTAASKIFTTGKSVVVLKQLNRFSLLQSSSNKLGPTLDFDTVCNHPLLHLAPFPELFDVALDAWVQSKHQHASSLLRQTLFDSCGLQTSLEALSHLYLMADGTSAALFTNSVFDKLDTLNTSWKDRFTLTELAQSTLGLIPSISPDRLRISILSLSRKQQEVSQCRRSVKSLSIIQFKYHLPWPIQIILTPATISSYQRIFTFLFQIRRSSHILSRQRLITDTLTNTSSSDERALYYSLRTRVLWFTQTLYYYLTSLVIEPCSQTMREALKEAEDVDAMIHVHTNFLKTTIDQALLSSKLELIHKTILKLLDLGVRLEDAQAANVIANKEVMEQQEEMMDLSMAGLGLHTSKQHGKHSQSVNNREAIRKKQMDDGPSSDEDEKEEDVDLSILSSVHDGQAEEVSYVENLRKMKDDFDRLVRFVANGLKGVARAGGGEEARSWDTLGEMLESGSGSETAGYR